MTITFGTKITADSNANNANIVELTATKAVVVYDDSASNNLRGRVITWSGGSLSAGAEQSITSGDTYRFPRLTKLSDTAIMAVWFNVSLLRMDAAVLTISGNTITPGAILTLTHDARQNDHDVSALSSTAVIYVYRRDPTDVNIARVLSVSGTTITENAAFTYESPALLSVANRVQALSSSKAVVVFMDGDNSDRPTGQVLDISGTTVTGNANAQLSTTTADNGDNDNLQITKLSSSKVLVGFKNNSDGLIDGIAVSESGGTLTPGTTKDTEDGVNFYYEVDISGTTITIDDSQVGQHNSNEGVAALSATQAIFSTDAFIVALDSTNLIAQFVDGTDLELLPLSVGAAGALSLASMTKPADIDAAGEYVYLALLDGGTPILTKIATDLLSDGTTVFDPGAGDNIGVQCGKFDSDVVWIAGNFGGTDTVEKSENGGGSFAVKDDGTFDPVTSFVVGPDSDGRVLIFEETGGTSAIQETTDSGASWEEKNSALGFVSKAVERLDVNIDELVTGNEAGANDNIHYSPNAGEDLEDYSTGFPAQDVTQIIVN